MAEQSHHISKYMTLRLRGENPRLPDYFSHAGKLSSTSETSAMFQHHEGAAKSFRASSHKCPTMVVFTV